jgi:outer membrane protein OmpA-like peptidoglycan-associated protein
MKSTSKTLKTIAAAALLSLPVLSTAQTNLIENGGFEANTGKIKKLGQIDLVTGWKSPTAARADVFLGDSKIPDIAAPTNIYGSESPKEGDNYAGIMAYSHQDKLPRTYLTAKLKTPLKEGQSVCVTFYVNLAEASKYSCNQIGMLIGKSEFSSDQKISLIDNKVSVIHPKNKVFNSFLGWEKICGTYTSEKGGEKFITIGNFSTNAETKPETNKKAKDNKFTPVIGAYYFVDDISVMLLEEKQTCDCNYEDAENKQFSTMIYQKSALLTDRMTAKEKIELQSVNFGFGKDELTPAAKTSLDLIVAELKANPTMTIIAQAHSDQEEVNYGESKPMYSEMDAKRGSMVKDYFKSKGIDPGRVKVELKGAAMPNTAEFKEGDNDELKQAKNRRVVFVVQ